MDDPLRPRMEPASLIYDAFQKEAEKRDGREFDEWLNAERQAVFDAAKAYAEKHGLTAPTMTQVIARERLAEGHTDYGAKWAIGVADCMGTKR